MSNLQDSFALRIICRLGKNRGKICPICGQADPLLILKDGRCANCTCNHKEEEHHLLRKDFRDCEAWEQAVILVSQNAHRLLSDFQAGHPAPPTNDPTSALFVENQLSELIVSLTELWLVLEYLNEMPELSRDIPKVVMILLALLFLPNLIRLDLSKVVSHAKRILQN